MGIIHYEARKVNESEIVVRLVYALSKDEKVNVYSLWKVGAGKFDTFANFIAGEHQTILQSVDSKWFKKILQAYPEVQAVEAKDTENDFFYQDIYGVVLEKAAWQAWYEEEGKDLEYIEEIYL